MSTTEQAPVQLHKTLAGLAVNPALPAELLRRVLGYRRGHGEVASRPDLTDDMITEIVTADDFWQAHTLALNRGVPDVFRMRLAEHRDPSIRRALVAGGENTPRDPDLPAELAEQLARNPEPSVRFAVAPHPNLPTSALTALLADQDEGVAETVAASPRLPVAEMARLLDLAGL